MFQKKINVQELKDRVTAIECLQEAGQFDDAVSVLTKLGNDILTKVKEFNPDASE